MIDRYFINRAPAVVACMLAVSLTTTSCSKASDQKVEAPAADSAARLLTQPLTPAPTDPSEVLATVNGKDITAGEIDRELATMMERMQGRLPPERIAAMREQMREQMLDNVITRTLLLDKVAQENITVDEAEYEKAIAKISENLPPGASLEDMLEQTGTSMEEFRKSLGMELQIQKLIEGHMGGKIEASEEEVAKFYEDNKEQFERPETVEARHILISVDPSDSDEVKAEKRKEIEALREQLIAGADFAELAKTHSACPSKAQGGSLGRFPRGRMVPEFEEAAFSQEIGAVGDVVETQFGYHLIKVEDRDEAGLIPLEEVKTNLTQYLTNQKQQKAVQAYVEELRAAADIKRPAPGGAGRTPNGGSN